ncbi:DUF2000 family protein, partial [Klebsiella variicola]|uniref:DUF2000 family protein n=1 Tax=Klebsiella variicola TaxID=244366 RepID=UPI001D122280
SVEAAGCTLAVGAGGRTGAGRHDVHAMFSTGHDDANRQVFLAEDADNLDLVGLAMRGPKKAVDKAIK